ncbi:MAG: DNA-directed RNA polymerase subunit D [Candidatus Micrarchaeota archaeon]
MKVDFEKEQANRIQFSLVGVSPTFANAIRRYGMMRIPVMAIDNITIYENTSSMFDEYLAQRIGLIPLVTPAKIPAESEAVFILDEVGPKLTTSKDLKSSDSEIVPARENVTIITLGEKQKLKLEAKAKLNIGATHAKYQSGILSYEIVGDDKFIFKVESLYHMPTREIVMRACDLIEDDITTIVKELKKVVK